jgi:hypothetical protein
MKRKINWSKFTSNEIKETSSARGVEGEVVSSFLNVNELEPLIFLESDIIEFKERKRMYWKLKFYKISYQMI